MSASEAYHGEGGAGMGEPPERVAEDPYTLLEILDRIMRYGELACLSVEQWPHNVGGKKPQTKDVWTFPRHMLSDIEDAIAAEKAKHPDA